MEKITRKEAVARGLKRYFTGLPCKNGHIDERFVSTAHCKECLRQRDVRRYRENPQRERERLRKYRDKNREALREYARRYAVQNPEETKKKNREWRARNPEYAAQWRRANANRVNAKTAERRSARVERTPAWADFNAIARVYAQAKLAEAVTGWPHHVDHIVPLRGKNVSGLHVENNLQILPYDENCAKSNAFEA